MIRVALFLLFAVSSLCFAQVDPEQRRLLQAGYEQPLSGSGPPGEYIFYYFNQPNFTRKDTNLRMAISPTYLDSELGIKHALGSHVDLGIGLAGGAFADNYYEVRQGHYLKNESFDGDGVTGSITAYPLFNPGQKIPLNGIIRFSTHLVKYQTTSDTAQDFSLPPDHIEYKTRIGLRLGGQPPMLRPVQAGEISVWYENQIRDRSATYGFEDRPLAKQVNLFWGRALFDYLQGDTRYMELVIMGGGSTSADHLSAYRLGGALPFSAEFPLYIPGYFNGELSARSFGMIGGTYGMPIVPDDRLWGQLFAVAANVNYLPGEGQPGPWNSGAGAGLRFESRKRIWLVEVNFAHGFNAIRSGGRGANSISIMIQWDWHADQKDKAKHRFIPSSPGNMRYVPRFSEF